MSETEAKVEVNGSTGSEEAKAPAPTPIFGSAATFGTSTGFGGFIGLATKAEGEGEEEGGDDEAPEEECKAEFKPIVQLEEVDVSTGEEDEECLMDLKCKLYRFDNDAGEWKERGVGQARLLQHRENKRIRFIMRQDKTLKIRGNHVVMPGTKVQEHSGSEKAMVFSCVDFADEVQKPELFCIRFGSAEKAQEFKTAYEGAAEKNEPLLGGVAAEKDKEEEKTSEVDAAADELAVKATVASDEGEEKKE